MKRLTVCTFVVAVLLAVSSSLPWRWSRTVEDATASMGSMSAIDLQTRISATVLPNEQIEDMSLVYPSAPKR